jgi:putative nucleotidyltransferase with HDIG domain
MKSKLDRDEILDSIHGNVQDKNMIRHMLATEAIMRTLARKLGEDEEEWGITGLIHDIDVELIEGDMSSHSKLGADIAQEFGATESMAHAILCHNEAHGVLRETKLDKALFCADPLSGLITFAKKASRPESIESKWLSARKSDWNWKSSSAWESKP